MSELSAYICATCGVQYPPSAAPPAHCPICEDERQYVNARGQSWTTPTELRATRQVDWRELEPGLSGLSATPQIAIGQRALIVAQPAGGVMWDCIPLVSEDAVARVKAAGVRVADTLPGLIDTAILPDQAKLAAPKEGMWRLLPGRAVAEAVWGAYHTDKIHWYVPPELHEFDTQATASPEGVRDAMIAMGGVLGGAENG